MARRNADVYHLTFHSSDIGVGGTPYVPTRETRDGFLFRLEGILDYIVHELHVQPTTSREYYELFRQRQKASAATKMGRELQPLRSRETPEVPAAAAR
jgi:hypothetical protein